MLLQYVAQKLKCSRPDIQITQNSKPTLNSEYLSSAYFIAASDKADPTYSTKELTSKFLSRVKSDKELSPKTIAQYERHLRIFTEIFHFDDIREMDRENAEQLLQLMYNYPKNPEKQSTLCKLKGIALIRKNQEINGDVVSRATVKKFVNLMSTFFQWAESHGYVKANFFYKLRVGRSGSYEPRYNLTNQELDRVFTMPDYKEGKFLHPYYYWLPLLLRFTGARMNELCQLRRADVICQEGVHGIQIHART
ncbi:tyrosine-type recombinase/integrase [Vibrio chagasii]|uniref:Core-binding (CB) domain-containing protein n=1 Tax=Vibrio chagasii TaxID=170679 RepID=A0A7Y3YND5_9VIBR|nr:hypothetical protein [Vibrio chagasii]NOH33661.1 hypothetical protein [Vibrio chagasii]